MEFSVTSSVKVEQVHLGGRYSLTFWHYFQGWRVSWRPVFIWKIVCSYLLDTHSAGCPVKMLLSFSFLINFAVQCRHRLNERGKMIGEIIKTWWTHRLSNLLMRYIDSVVIVCAMCERTVLTQHFLRFLLSQFNISDRGGLLGLDRYWSWWQMAVNKDRVVAWACNLCGNFIPHKSLSLADNIQTKMLSSAIWINNILVFLL